jgi:hypothetical protein
VAKPPADNAFALALQGVKRSIEDQTREREDAARRAAAAARARSAGRDLFRKAVADVTPLPPSDRLEPPRPEVPAWPAQRVADEQRRRFAVDHVARRPTATKERATMRKARRRNARWCGWCGCCNGCCCC